MKKTRRVSDSETVISAVMMPTHANHYGSVHGGTILKLVDEAAFVVATKHARKNVVVASMDHIVFSHPVNLGDLLNISARIRYAGHTSMEIEVDIETEKLKQGKTLHVGSAHLTMVALNDKGKPTKVPSLTLATKDEKLKSKKALAIRKKRLSK